MMVWELTPRDPSQFFQVEAQKWQNNLFDSEYKFFRPIEKWKRHTCKKEIGGSESQTVE